MDNRIVRYWARRVVRMQHTAKRVKHVDPKYTTAAESRMGWNMDWSWALGPMRNIVLLQQRGNARELRWIREASTAHRIREVVTNGTELASCTLRTVLPKQAQQVAECKAHGKLCGLDDDQREK
mmetsp:Transcript_16303/g.33114  ORF Transcript_16303/g.33114 Transcript_16303/m.33114 type:complete len:124 (+) Transcript_16303:71-442(+)